MSIVSSSYYAATTRPRSPRAERDERVLAEIRRVHAHPELGRGLYGTRKVYHQLRREAASTATRWPGARWSG